MTCIRPFAEMNYIFEAAIKAFVNFVLDIVRHKCPDILEKLGLLPTTQNIVKTTSNESVLNGTNSSAASNVDNEVRLSKESAVTVSEPPYFAVVIVASGAIASYLIYCAYNDKEKRMEAFLVGST